MDKSKKAEIKAALAEVDWENLRRVLCRESLIHYMRRMAPWFMIEEVHCAIAIHLEALSILDIDRLMMFLPPRTGKSSMVSQFFPSWWAGKFPSDQILQVGHSVDLSRGFSLDVRAFMNDPEYQWIFPGIRLAKDAKAAGKWRVEEVQAVLNGITAEARAEASKASKRQKQGQYNAAGVTSNIAGKGFNLGIADDPMSEQDKDSKIVKDRLWNWWPSGFYTRRQPERNVICLTMTRWAKDDLAGRLLEQQERGGDQWTVLNVPALLDRDSAKKIYTIAEAYDMPDRKPLEVDGSFAPRRWPVKELIRTKNSGMPDRDWQALYMGNPKAIEGKILKKAYWRLWPKPEMPECDFIFTMYDTAMEKGKANDLSARTSWGIFRHREKEGERESFHMMLLEAWSDRVETPELRAKVVAGVIGGKRAIEVLRKHYPRDPESLKYIAATEVAMHPDLVLIEKKGGASGLIQELRRMTDPAFGVDGKLPVQGWKLPRNSAGEMDKYARALLGSVVLEQGAVWYPDKLWAEKVIDQCADCAFDGSDDTDDLPDTVTASLVYVRQKYRIELGSDIDEDAEAKAQVRRPKRRMYGGARS